MQTKEPGCQALSKRPQEHIYILFEPSELKKSILFAHQLHGHGQRVVDIQTEC